MKKEAGTELTVVEVAPVVIAEVPEMSLGTLVELLVTSKADPAIVERMVALKERMEDRFAASEFNKAMARFAGECPNIKKSSTASIVTKSGTKFTYTYAELDEIARVTRPILQRCGLSYTFDSRVDGGTLTATCTLRHTHGHAITAMFSCPLDSQNPMSGAQKVGAALTYAKRQALVSALGLTTTDDDTDGADPVDVAKVTQDQADTLRALAEEVKVDVKRILKAAKVDRLEDVLASQYARYVAMLEAKREAK